MFGFKIKFVVQFRIADLFVNILTHICISILRKLSFHAKRIYLRLKVNMSFNFIKNKTILFISNITLLNVLIDLFNHIHTIIFSY